MREACYILGSGSSLLDLTPAQKDVVQRSGRVLAMNKYLIFYKKIGIVPDYLALQDRHFPSPKVVYHSIRTAQTEQLPTVFCLSAYYRPYFEIGKPVRFIKRRIAGLLRHRWWAPLRFPKNVRYFTPRSGEDPDHFSWAESLEDELYYYRGSLSTVLNLANLLFPECDIVLLGVDLNTHQCFFDEELKKRPDLIDQYFSTGVESGKHPTTLTAADLPGITHVLPEIFAHLATKGIQVYSANPTGTLVKDKLCPYIPLEETPMPRHGVF